MKNIICMFVATLFTTGCGELAYKRGASAKDFDTSKKSCQSTGNEAAIEKCLEDNGWVVQKLDALGLPDSELFATANVSDDNRNPYQTLPIEAAPIEKAPAQPNTTQTEATPSETKQIIDEKAIIVNTKPAQTESVKKSDSVAKEVPINAKVAADTPKKEAPTAKNPFEKYKINSWWKMGGGRDALELSMATCSKKLGDAHQPDRKNQIFTRAFAACMYENGWRGLREK
jgi:uncharacterized protein YceK